MTAEAASSLTSVVGLDSRRRNAIVISELIDVDHRLHALSRYGDSVWDLSPYVPNANIRTYQKRLNWLAAPMAWRESVKAAVFTYWRSGLPGVVRPKAMTVLGMQKDLLHFVRWLDHLGLIRFEQVTPLHCANYVQALRDRDLAGKTLRCRFSAVELLYHLRDRLPDALSQHPWPESSAVSLAGLSQRGPPMAKTEAIPIGHAAQWFQACLRTLEQAGELMAARKALDHIEATFDGSCTALLYERKNDWLAGHGLPELREFSQRVADIRTAVYVLLAMGSGARNHELADIRGAAVYATEQDGMTFHWLKSTSLKTHVGQTQWLVPAIALRAVQVLEGWSSRLRAQLDAQLARLRAQWAEGCEALRKPALLSEIRRIEANRERLFLGLTERQGHRIHALSGQGFNDALKRYARRQGLSYVPTTHQFRRTYAVMMANGIKGIHIDLVTLRDHFKHWSLDMTTLYAANPEQDAELYEMVGAELRTLDLNIITHWLEDDVRIAGGLAGGIKAYRKNHKVTTVKDRRILAEKISDQVAIRGTGHSWCLADDNGCGGQGLYEATRCVGCKNSVIDDNFKAVWRGIWLQQTELLKRHDIGPGGMARVERDLARAEQVLNELGVDTSETIHEEA